MNTTKKPATLVPLLLALLGACAPAGASGGGDGDGSGAGGKADSSAVAVFLSFEMEGSVWTNSAWNPESQVEAQVFYTIGHLNGDNSLGRLDKLEISDVRTENQDGGTLIHYKARLPVAWGRRNDVPTSYTFRLPRDVSSAGLNTFVEKYGHSCVDWGAHDVDSGIMWYYYRPERSGCNLEASDVVEVRASVTPSNTQTTGKFPEYHEVWEDDVLNVVAIFGKFEDGATSSTDAGISAYNRFVKSMRDHLAQFDLVTTPASIPTSPGTGTPDIEFAAELPDGRRVHVVALLVDNPRIAGPTFDARYAELSADADMIAYNGHAGLGANIRALAAKGEWKPGQYVVVFMNGCDTYAYVDGAIAEAHAEINPDDPTGSKYVDIVTNAMPSFFSSMPNATMAIFRGLMSYEEPKTYEQIFANIDTAQVVLVSGEEDNTFVPGGGGGEEPPPEGWAGLEETGRIAAGEEKRWSTPTLAQGRYVFEMTGTGDADLYVRIGTEPTESVYDCRPYASDSDERCAVDITTPAAVHVMVAGYASSSEFRLVGRPE